MPNTSTAPRTIELIEDELCDVCHQFIRAGNRAYTVTLPGVSLDSIVCSEECAVTLQK